MWVMRYPVLADTESGHLTTTFSLGRFLKNWISTIAVLKALEKPHFLSVEVLTAGN
jgi:hypothetical protein